MSKITLILFNIIEFSIALLIILLFYLTINLETSRVINIPQGSSNYIISHLDKNNYEMNSVDKLVLRFIGSPQSGWIDLKATKMTKLDFLYKLTTSKAALKKVTLLPGETYYFFLQEVARTLNISTYELFDHYATYAYKKDGNILADTYHLPIGMKEDQVIKYLFRQSSKEYEHLSNKIFGMYNKKNWYRYITIASIIQKEAASKKEMPIISSVIYNRLKKDMKLQMDGTLNYANFSHTKVTPKMIKEDTTDYNTYKNKGLPSDPICAVEFEAIKAAIFPTKSDYLYFVKSKDGKGHIFTSSYKEHRKNINKLKRYNKKKKRKKTKQKSKKVKKKVTKVQKKSTKTKKQYKLRDLWSQ